jgi:hypothetical protein
MPHSNPGQSLAKYGRVVFEDACATILGGPSICRIGPMCIGQRRRIVSETRVKARIHLNYFALKTLPLKLLDGRITTI